MLTLAETPFLSPQVVPDAIQRLPKCNLHTHMEGSVRPRTLFELAQAQGIPFPSDERQVAELLQVNGRETSLVDYLDRIARTYPMLKNASALQRVCREAVEDAARCNVRYLELRAGPAIHATRDLPVRAVIAAMLAGLAEGEAQYGVTSRLIIVALRHHGPQINVELAHAAVEFKDRGVVGFDLAGDEAGFPGALHKRAFDVARAGRLGITVHAGEAGGPSEVRYAIKELGATRIGHGIHSQEDPSVVDLIVQRGVMLEVCPTSNVHTATVPSIDAHPVRRFFERGLRLTISDDDPTTSRTNVARELTLLHERFHFTLPQLQALQVMGLENSFIPEQYKAKLLDEFKEYS